MSNHPTSPVVQAASQIVVSMIIRSNLCSPVSQSFSQSSHPIFSVDLHQSSNQSIIQSSSNLLQPINQSSHRLQSIVFIVFIQSRSSMRIVPTLSTVWPRASHMPIGIKYGSSYEFLAPLVSQSKSSMHNSARSLFYLSGSIWSIYLAFLVF